MDNPEKQKTEGIIKNGQSRETEKTEGIIKNGQSRETGNIGHKTQNRDKQNKKTQHRKLKR